MKKFVWAPVALMGIFALAGCGGSNGSTSDNGNDASTEGGAPPNNNDSGNPGNDATVSGDDGSTGDGAPACGNGVVEGTESCDDGAKNGTPGDPCTNSCTWLCIQGDPKLGDPACNTSNNPCIGHATCQANHTCLAGTPLGQGASCGTNQICNNGACAPVVCGDGIVTSPTEECDDGSKNGTAGDGCDSSCKFVCVSADPKRDCAPADLCAGKGTCNDTTHTCTAGTPLGDGTGCNGASGVDAGAGDAGPLEVCKGGTCTVASCGDGIVEPSLGEQCDFGTGNGPGTGCELDCKFSCTLSPNNCTQPADVCKGPNTCTAVTVSGASGQKCVQGAALADGTPCTGGTCKGSSCNVTTCGNGTLDPGEQCDFGSTGGVSNNKPGSGCEPDCKFSCQKSPDTCSPTDLCAASPVACQNVTGPNVGQNGDVGQKCQAVTGTKACGTCDLTTTGDFVCVSNACAKSVCGDGCVDTRTGEQCEPPNTATCDANCHTITPAVCGNSIREKGEQCDDGNTVNLDGCDSKCQFEQDHRANSVAIAYSGGPATMCTNNMLGEKVLTSTAGGQLNSGLTTGVNGGTTNIQFKFMGISDLAGVSQSSGLALGAISGPPTTTTGFTGSNLDWWYTTQASTLDGSRNPKSQLPATFATAALKATGTIDLAVVLAGSPATLHLSSTVITANVGSTSTPTVSTGATPGHLASEHLDPALKSFDSMSNGLLCGNISAASLATVPAPAALITGGATACSAGYKATNSLLDMIVGGCVVFILPVINASPTPDQVDPGAPAAGAGPPYTLSEQGGLTVNQCTDKNGTVVDLATCLAAAAYSADFNFTSNRVIMK